MGSGKVPRKKKITRLIPAEESLAVIDECTERSEDASVSSESDFITSPRRYCKDSIDKLVSQTINESLGENSSLEDGPPVPPMRQNSGGEENLENQQSAEEPAAKKPVDETDSNGTSTTEKLTDEEEEDSLHIRDLEPPSRKAAGSSKSRDVAAKDGRTSSKGGGPGSGHGRNKDLMRRTGSNTAKDDDKDVKIFSSTDSQPLNADSQPWNELDVRLPKDPKASSTTRDVSAMEKVVANHAEHQRSVKLHESDADQIVKDSDSVDSGQEWKDMHGSDEFKDGTSGHPSMPEHDGPSLDASDYGHQSTLSDEGLFDFDDFGTVQEDADKEEMLSWRLDRAQSLSDWTLVIKCREDQSVTSYYLHKNILAVGPRKSEYFVNVFRISRVGDLSHTNKTEIELGRAAARVIPQFLDFLYSSDGALKITTDSATGLRFVSQFFGVRVLHKKVMNFIQKDLKLFTVVTYYNDVCALRDEKLLATIAKYCAKNIMKIGTSFPLIDIMDPFFFVRILSSSHINSKEKRYHCSILLAEFCRKNGMRFDSKLFMMLCDEKNLPLVHYSAALTLLEMEADLVVLTRVENLLEMSSLQKRCVVDLATHWKDLSQMDVDQVTRVCRKLPSGVVTDLLLKSLAKAKESISTVPDTPIEMPEKPRRRASTGVPERGIKRTDSAGAGKLKDNEAKFEKAQKEHQDELLRLKKEYETNLVRLRDLLVEKDKTISKFWHEIKSYERLPNNIDGKIMSSGRNHEASYVPDIRPIAKDGYLVAMKKNSMKYPLFYYKKDDGSTSESTSTTGR